MRTVAVIGTFDTKQAELGFLAECLREFGLAVLTIDVSTSAEYHSCADVPREAVSAAGGHPWDELRTMSRDEMRATMTLGASRILGDRLKSGGLDGVAAAGGVQNTTVVAQAMWTLPMGLPKVIVSTVASGSRPFDMIVGTHDITVIPAITDVAGLNRISRMILRDAAAAIAGMVTNGPGPIALSAGGATVVGATLMGAINDGAAEAIQLLQDQGYEVLSFHSTGVGGQVLEELIREGTITAVVDMSLHEIVHELIGGGFCSGANGRLTAAAEAGIPIVAAPGATDFMCYLRGDVTDEWLQRQHIWHNAGLAHFALSDEEAIHVAETIADRLNAAKGPVTVVVPTQSLRVGTEPGGPFAHPHLDALIINTLTSRLRPDIDVRRVDAPINSSAFAHSVVGELGQLLAKEPSHV